MKTCENRRNHSKQFQNHPFRVLIAVPLPADSSAEAEIESCARAWKFKKSFSVMQLSRYFVTILKPSQESQLDLSASILFVFHLFPLPLQLQSSREVLLQKGTQRVRAVFEEPPLSKDLRRHRSSPRHSVKPGPSTCLNLVLICYTLSGPSRVRLSKT